MKLPNSTVTFDDGTVSATITVRAATVLDSVRRGRLSDPPKDGDTDIDRINARTWIYAPCVAVACAGEIVIDGKAIQPGQLGFEEFCNLPAELGEAWYVATLDANPTWRFPDVEKKALTPGSEELTGSPVPNPTKASRKRHSSTT